MLLGFVTAQVEGGDDCGEQQHRSQFDHQQIRAEQADAHGLRVNGGVADGLAALVSEQDIQQFSSSAARTTGPSQMPGLSQTRSWATEAGPRLSIITTNTNSTMMAPA